MAKTWQFGLFVSAVIAVSLMGCGSKASTTATSSTTPSVFYAHSVAFRNSTTLTWGDNAFGQLGINNITNTSSPGVVIGGATGLPVFIGMTSVAAGGTHTLAVSRTGSAYAWGNNGFGQVGDNSTTARMVPVQVVKLDGTPLSGVTAVSAGGNHSLAIANDGTGVAVWAWGEQFLRTARR